MHHTSGGLSSLRDKEKIYYAVGCLVGEVYNGGLQQFFFNGAGSMYGTALDGLLILAAQETAELLVCAKNLLFGKDPVPVDTDARRNLLKLANDFPGLDELDQKFWKNTENIDERCKKYALSHGLYES